jgi:4'-phosphopantetheinyl transferase
MRIEPAPGAPPPWDEVNVHLWWRATAAHEEAPRARRARLDRLLRRVLAPYLDLPPAALQFGREARGRPFLRHDRAPDFNLSDTTGGTLVAVAAQARIGVDLERTDRNPPHRRLARRYFDADECESLETMSDDEARRAFLRLWTAKEASCKSTGTGIYGQLDRWRFDPANDTVGLRGCPDAAAPLVRWHHLRVAPAPGYTAVLACDGFAPRPREFILAP